MNITKTPEGGFNLNLANNDELKTVQLALESVVENKKTGLSYIFEGDAVAAMKETLEQVLLQIETPPFNDAS